VGEPRENRLDSVAAAVRHGDEAIDGPKVLSKSLWMRNPMAGSWLACCLLPWVLIGACGDVNNVDGTETGNGDGEGWIYTQGNHI